MTRIAVSPEALNALATRLGQVADDVAATARQGTQLCWSLGDGHAQGALGTLLGDFEHQRLVLEREGASLAARLRAAGTAYAEVDDSVFADVGAPRRAQPGGCGAP